VAYDAHWDPAGGDGIVFAFGDSPDGSILTTNPGNAESFQVTGDQEGLSGTTSDDPNVNFRIGLQKKFTAYNAETKPARYALVKLSYNDLTKYTYLYIRQGEGADYVMRPGDPDGAGNAVADNRAHAVKFSPYNLTAATLNADPGFRGGIFTDYPTQAGALFQCISVDNPRYAWDAYTSGDPSSGGWTDYVRPAWDLTYWNTFGLVHETCPAGYRRPNSGPIDANYNATISEYQQSLWLDVPFANSVVGCYADGFFDRRAIGNGAAGVYIGVNSTVCRDSRDIAHLGKLFYNVNDGEQIFNSLFFPNAGLRNNTNGLLNASGFGVAYWSSGIYYAGISAQSGVQLWANGPVEAMRSAVMGECVSIRCVRQE